MPPNDSTAMKAFRLIVYPFSLNIHKCTYLTPSHFQLTLFSLCKSKLWFSRFPIFNLKVSRFVEGHLKECFNTNDILYVTVHLWAKFTRNNQQFLILQLTSPYSAPAITSVYSHSLLSVLVTKSKCIKYIIFHI